MIGGEGVKGFLLGLGSEARKLWRQLSVPQRVSVVGISTAAAAGLAWITLEARAVELAGGGGADVPGRGLSSAGVPAAEPGPSRSPKLDEGGLRGSLFETPWSRERRDEDLKRRRIEVLIAWNEKIEKAGLEFVKERTGRFAASKSEGSALLTLLLAPGVERLSPQEAEAFRASVCAAYNLGPESVTVTDNLGRCYSAAENSDAERLQPPDPPWRHGGLLSPGMSGGIELGDGPHRDSRFGADIASAHPAKGPVVTAVTTGSERLSAGGPDAPPGWGLSWDWLAARWQLLAPVGGALLAALAIGGFVFLRRGAFSAAARRHSAAGLAGTPEARAGRRESTDATGRPAFSGRKPAREAVDPLGAVTSGQDSLLSATERMSEWVQGSPQTAASVLRVWLAEPAEVAGDRGGQP